MKIKNVILVFVCVAVVLGIIGSMSKKEKLGGVESAVAGTAARVGYTLKPKETTLLDQLLKDEVAAFSNGRNSMFFGDQSAWISAVQVATDYASNQVAGDQKYYKKTLFISGIIASINSGLGNEPYLALIGGNLFLSPQAHFDASNAPKIATLQRGQEVRIVCDGGGAVIGTPIFKNCVFADNYANQKLNGVKDQIRNFLSGKEVQSDRIGSVIVLAIVGARLLPDESSCFHDGEHCIGELKEVLKDKASSPILQTVVDELKADGLRVPDVKINGIAPASEEKKCAEPEKTIFLRPSLGYEVAGTGRLYFYTGPSEECIDKNVFVVPGDSLIAYKEYEGWSQASFASQSGKTYNGWVASNRLKFIGTEGTTEEGDLEFYEKAANDAQAGKLGSPWAK